MSELGHIARASGSAVGAGIAASIKAQASKSDADGPEAWVHFCCTAADEAYAAVMEAPPTERREVGSAQKLLRKLSLDRPRDSAPQLWHELSDDERARAERSGWTATGWNLSREQPEDDEEDAYESVTLAGAELAAAAHSAALTAFRACMPKLTGRRATQAYIACVAVGVQRGYFTGAESKALLYTAQLALSAHPSRRTPRRK